MSITVILTNGIIPTPSLGQHMKMVMCQVKDLIQIQPKPCLCQGSNQWPLAFDKECSFKLSDCEEGKSFIVQIKKTRWMRRSKVLHLIQFFLPLENSFYIPDEVVGTVHLGPKSENLEGRRQWEQAIQSPGIPCTKWYPLN